jgi:hypothetical protein
MRRPFGEHFSIFFEPRAPAAFLVGSLALGVAGSAAYSLLSALLGNTLWAQGGLLLSAVLVLLFAAGVLNRAGQVLAARAARGRLAIPDHQQIAAHAGLVLPVGLREHGPEWPILEWHVRMRVLRHCWLLVTPQIARSVKLGNLRQWLLEHDVEVHVREVADPLTLRPTYDAASESLVEAKTLRGALPVAVDITGGTAMMSVALALAAREAGVPVQYYPATYDSDGTVRSGAEAPLLAAFVETQAGAP